MAEDKQEIRAILAPLAEGHVLLPNNVVAEVIAFTKPEPYGHSPAWLLGEIDWNDWQLPVISFATLSGVSTRDPVSSGSRILVIKTLTDSTSVVYLGIHINGLPRLARVTPANLAQAEDQPKSASVFARVVVNEQTALIPELNKLTAMVEKELHKA